ncbi:MAG: low molecular weight phosphotyrosine protein phosphatase [Clostridia bacterium]|nr:MAG: low molecular weight phosphotyrosine protein phosphatase [Clostridia bacterium]
MRILFVSRYNICRSPVAEAIFRDLLESRNISDDVEVDSAGTADDKLGQPPCTAMSSIAAARGLALSQMQARLVRMEDFLVFDAIYAMDGATYQELMKITPAGEQQKVMYFLEFAPNWDTLDVPAPDNDGGGQVDAVFEIVEDGALALLQHLLRTRICPG